MLAILIAACVSAEPVVVIDASLNETRGELLKLEGKRATVRTVPVGETPAKDVVVSSAAALVQAAGWGPQRMWPGTWGARSHQDGGTASSWRVELVDRSLVIGELLSGTDGGLIVLSQLLGRVSIKVEDLRSLELSWATVPAASGKDDTAGLLNGDRVAGFVEGFGVAAGGNAGDGRSAGLTVTIERDKAKTVLPLERLAWLVMSNPLASPGPLVWIRRSGERSAAMEFAARDGEARIVRSKGSLAVSLPLEAVDGALLEPGSLTALASLTSEGPLETGPLQPLGTRDLSLAGHVTVIWNMPAGVSRITGWAVLPEECRALGDCTLVLSVHKAEGSVTHQIASLPLNAATPVQRIDALLPEGGGWTMLKATVAEVRNGPVHDKVVLRRILLGTGTDASARVP